MCKTPAWVEKGPKYIHSLRTDRHAANGDDVGVDDTAGGRAITVGNVPGLAGLELGSGRVTRSVDRLPIHIGGGRKRGEDPKIRRAGVKVQVEDLGRGADGHGGHVGVVKGVDGGAGGAALLALEELVVHAGGVGHGGGEPVRDGRLVLEVGLVHGQGAIVLVALTLDLVEGRAALLERVRRDGGGDSDAGESSRDEHLGGNHLVFCVL